ncbi:helix-turn-helix domain-containing protein [Cellulosimicrobium funkei]|uniref:helix-turn-helix domain-containing protein n=1 Tax=Cellulosimicrobium funkei TaxID=264251 RepID=UPI000640361E|nr:helix-turn-helix domain-containing protein [Cellulosimicrobium funkei]
MDTSTLTSSATVGGLEPLLTAEDLATYLGIPVSTVRDWRCDGKGPCGVWVGKHLRYLVSDVHAWLTEQRELRPGEQPKGR